MYNKIQKMIDWQQELWDEMDDARSTGNIQEADHLWEAYKRLHNVKAKYIIDERRCSCQN